ncbi:MAG TPA: fibronectin type III domain-containing protein, partial [Flavobacteriales bacterium]|nr:fibronectin type III domain-containing protein [Flavobacteriales bacterium]
MNKLFHTATLLFLPVLASAQVSTYEFSESVGTYTPITAADGGVALGVPTYWPHVNNNRAWVNNPFNDPDGQVTQSGYLNPANGPGYPIGFDFEFNGDVFDVIGISNGGWISFGKSSDGLQAVWVYNWSGTGAGDPFRQWAAENAEPGPNPTYRRNRVAGFGNSGLQQVDWSSLAPPGQVSKLRMATIGTAPNRVCVVQWEDYGLRGDITVAMNKINFQIRLNEADNSVEVVFGPQNWVSSLGRYKRTQCGLSGRSNLDFNGRMTVYEQPAFLYDWNATVAADTNAAICQFEPPQIGQPNNSGVPPVLGLTWRWDPPVCPPPAWPLVISDISFDYANATWDNTNPGEFEYFLSTINSVSGPEITSGTTTDPEIALFGLEPLTRYYLFIRRICNGEPGPWSMGTTFRTIGGAVINCDGTATYVNYCTHQNDVIDWQYVSADGSQLRLEFLGGFLSGNTPDQMQIWIDGTPDSGPATYTMTSGDPTGLQYLANSSIWIRITTEQGSCETQNWFLPFEWRIGCKNCTDPLASFSLGEVDCDNQQYYVDVNIFSMGSSATLSLENNLGLPATVVSTTGIHQAGPFPAGQGVIVTAQNPDNEMCYAASIQLVAPPCATQDCGPTTYTHCYDNDEHSLWAYQGEGSQNIGI